MHIQKKTKEVIRVIHNTEEDFYKNVENLIAEGWSENTRVSGVGISLITQPIYEEDIERFNRDYPEVTVYRPNKNSWLRSEPYYYLTQHERIIGD